mgnify:CR=1 FL=1
MGQVVTRIIEEWDRRVFRAWTTAIQVGDYLYIDAAHDYKVVPMSAATQDATFVGISETEIKATEQDGDPVIVMTRGLIKAKVSSAVYHFGAGLLWVNASTLADDAAANTIAWVYDDSTATRTEITVLIDILKLGKLVEAASA